METVIIYIFIIIVLLIIVKVFLILPTARKKFKEGDKSILNGFRVGNGRLQGDRDYQTNYFATIQNNDDLLVVISDGITDNKKGELASVLAVEILKGNFKNNLYRVLGLEAFFKRSTEQIRKRLEENILSPNLGLISALIIGKTMYYMSTGNNKLFLYRSGELIDLTCNKEVSKKLNNLQIKRKDLLLFASTGASEGLTEMEILCHLPQTCHPQDKCQRLLQKMHEKRLKYQKNSVIIILEQMDKSH